MLTSPDKSRYVLTRPDKFQRIPTCPDTFRYIPKISDVPTRSHTCPDTFRYVPIHTDAFRQVSIHLILSRYVPTLAGTFHLSRHAPTSSDVPTHPDMPCKSRYVPIRPHTSLHEFERYSMYTQPTNPPLGVAMLASDARHATHEALVPRRASAAFPKTFRRTLQGQDAVLVLAWGQGKAR